jgi:hypothetical protein
VSVEGVKIGRPTKFNAERAALICDALRNGATRKAAAEANGITYRCFLQWMQAGEEAEEGDLFHFFHAVTCAEAQAENACAARLMREAEGGQGDWKAATEWLKRRRRDDWSEKQIVDANVSRDPLDGADLEAMIEALKARGIVINA